MAKDPAFPFYSQDFLVGTMFLTDEEVGIYTRLMCIQHQHGGIIDKNTFNQKTQNFPNLKFKFIESEDGFYNKRLMEEMVKRQNKSNNLSANAILRWEKEKQKQCNCITIAKPSENEIDIEIDNEIESKEKKEKKFKKPTPIEIADYARSRGFDLDGEYFYDKYEGNGWVVGQAKTKMRDWKAVVRTWQTNDYPTKTKRREPIPNQNGEFHELQEVVRKTQKISLLPLQLSFEEAEKLRNQYGTEELSKVFRAMENRSDLLAKNDSVYYTAKGWLGK